MHSACEQNMLPKLSQCDRDYINFYLWLSQPAMPPRLGTRAATPSYKGLLGYDYFSDLA